MGLAVVLLWPVGAWGQARSRYLWNRLELPGIRTIGGYFTLDSNSLGGLRRTSPYGGGNLLRSGLRGPASYQLTRRGYGGSGQPKLGGFSSTAKLSGQFFGGANMTRLSVPTELAGPSGTTVKLGAEAVLNLQPYLAVMGHTTALKEQGDKPITSFVPTEESVYKEHMERGDSSFRQGRFSQALGSFNVAVTIARYSPESHLYVVHGAVALGKYYKAAHHLRKALDYFPELPLVNMKVRGFYGEAGPFVEQMDLLQKRAEDRNSGSGPWLLLAYFRYFDGKEGEAADALRKALRLSKDKAMTEAVRTFWDGMVAAGKASGSLEPTTQPAEAKGSLPRRPAGTSGSETSSEPLEPTTRPAGAQGASAAGRGTETGRKAAPR